MSARGDAPFCISTALLLSFFLSASNSPSGSSNATLTFYRRQDQGSQAISPKSNSSNAKPGTLASEPPPTTTTLCRFLKDAQHSLTESLLDRKKTRQWGFISFDPRRQRRSHSWAYTSNQSYLASIPRHLGLRQTGFSGDSVAKGDLGA